MFYTKKEIFILNVKRFFYGVECLAIMSAFMSAFLFMFILFN